MNSILDLDKPFIVFAMRYWKGEAAVKCLNEFKHSQSWCEKQGSGDEIVPVIHD